MTILTTILASKLYSGIAALLIAAAMGPLLKMLLEKIPTEPVKKKFGSLMYGLGCFITLGLAKWKYTKKFWNSTIEPWVIIFIESLITFGLSEFIRGLRSDNQD